MTMKERNTMVIDNMNLVHSVAQKVPIPHTAYYSYEDIVQEGMIGLIKAAEYYNPDSSYSFSTYAVSMIQGYILTFTRKSRYKLKYRDRDYDNYNKIKRIGKSPSEVSEEDLIALKIDKKDYLPLMSMEFYNSLDEERYVESAHQGTMTLGDMIPARTEEFSEEYYQNDLRNIKNSLVSSIKNPIKVDIINDWFEAHLVGEELKQYQLQDKYGVSKSWISKIIIDFKFSLYNELVKLGYNTPASA